MNITISGKDLEALRIGYKTINSKTISLELSKDELNSLEIEFKKLESIDEKFEFWDKKLKISYCFWSYCEYHLIKPFYIHYKNPNERKEIREKIINQFIVKFNRVNSNFKALILDELISSYKKELSSIKRKEYVEKKRISEIESIVEKKREMSSDFLVNHINERFINAYENSFLKDITPDEFSALTEIDSLISVNNGFVLGEFHKYLLGINIFKKKEATTKQQILALHYSGLISSCDLSKNKLSKVLSIVLNKNEQDIREVLTYLNHPNQKYYRILTPTNLNFLETKFSDLQLTDFIDKIKVDKKELKL